MTRRTQSDPPVRFTREIDEIIEAEIFQSVDPAPFRFESQQAVNRVIDKLTADGWVVAITGRQRSDDASEFVVTLTRGGEAHEYADMTLALAVRWAALRTVGIDETGRVIGS